LADDAFPKKMLDTFRHGGFINHTTAAYTQRKLIPAP